MTAIKARKLMKKFLDERGIAYSRLQAKTVDFTDLARDSAVFVKIYGFVPSEVNYIAVKNFGKENGFIADPQ